MSSDSAPDRTPRVYETLKQRYAANREVDAGAPWREWLRERYAKYWYVIGSLLLDGMVFGTIVQATDPTQTWPYALALAVVIGLGYAEFLGLRRFWPPKSRA